MTFTRLLGVALIAAGVFGLLYGGFSFTKQTHDLKLGPLEFAWKEKQAVSIPLWVDIAAIVAGAALLLVRGRKG